MTDEPNFDIDTPSFMNSIDEAAFCASLDTKYLSKILFLASWTEPSNFRTAGAEERRKLMNELRPQAVPPRRNAMWIWFGAYTKLINGNHPVIRRDGRPFKVARALFIDAFGQTDVFKSYQDFMMDTRQAPNLRYAGPANHCDVNPWHYCASNMFSHPTQVVNAMRVQTLKRIKKLEEVKVWLEERFNGQYHDPALVAEMGLDFLVDQALVCTKSYTRDQIVTAMKEIHSL